jgi:hypothetical protein
MRATSASAHRAARTHHECGLGLLLSSCGAALTRAAVLVRTPLLLLLLLV